MLSIGSYTLHTWGEAQAIRYIDELEDSCQRIADIPTLGRPCDRIRPGLCRREAGRHVIFFRRTPTGIQVSRILHERMLPESHAFFEEE